MTLFLYNLITGLYFGLLKIASGFHPKAALFVRGRKGLFQKIQQTLQGEQRKVVWMHCASLGEFEQGRPILKTLKAEMPEYALVLTFFSPSGYEGKQNTPDADYVFYLPTDTADNARKFIALTNPAFALFVKYEFWYHYLNSLQHAHIPVILFSAYFQPGQPFFKWYGGFYRRMLHFYKQIFVQDRSSLSLLESINIRAVQIAGDTRIDRSLFVKEHCKPIPRLAAFKGSSSLLVAGSTWRNDIQFLKKTFEGLEDKWKILIAPHETDAATIREIEQTFKETVLWDAVAEPAGERIMILNVMGVLNEAYQYADAVWIGGGFSKGIHNIIEPAVFGVPVFFGPNHQRFREAQALIDAGGGASLSAPLAFRNQLLRDANLAEMGKAASAYVKVEAGASRIIMRYLFKWRSNTQ